MSTPNQATARRKGPTLRANLLMAIVLLSSMPGLDAQCADGMRQTRRLIKVKAAALTEVQIQHPKPQTAAPLPLGQVGYTEREFFAQGPAYLTRVMVRVPQPDRFNGTLLVEWADASLGTDMDVTFATSHPHMLRRGYAVALVSVDSDGVADLRRQLPLRYSPLTLGADPQEVFSQVTMALKANQGAQRPLAALQVKKIIAMAHGRAAEDLAVYRSTLHTRHRVVDGFVLADQASRPLHADVHTPTILVNSEATVVAQPALLHGRSTRVWEVAGASPLSHTAMQYLDRMVLRDGSLPGSDGPQSLTQRMTKLGCEHPPSFSPVDPGPVLNAAIEAVQRWITRGLEAPPSLTFERTRSGQVARDPNGQVRGGVQLAAFKVPSELLDDNGPTPACVQAGHRRGLSLAELQSRQLSTEQGFRIAQETMREARLNGYVLRQDETSAVWEAAQVQAVKQ